MRRLTAIPHPQKADETDDPPPIHRFQFVDYLANRVRPHVPVEDPI